MAQRMREMGHKPSPHALEAAAEARRGVPPPESHRQASAARWSGEGNPQWKDGRAYERYGPGYGRAIRAAVIERDKVCQDCGGWDERPKAMQVHHIDEDTTNHGLDNLVLLCVKCHKARHAAST